MGFLLMSSGRISRLGSYLLRAPNFLKKVLGNHETIEQIIATILAMGSFSSF